MPHQEQDRLAVDHLLKGVTDKASAMIVINSDPKSLLTAIEQLRLTYHNRIAIYGDSDKGKINPQVRQVSVCNRVSPKNRKFPSPKVRAARNSRIHCWNCGGRHLQRDCRRSRSSGVSRGRTSAEGMPRGVQYFMPISVPVMYPPPFYPTQTQHNGESRSSLHPTAWYSSSHKGSSDDLNWRKSSSQGHKNTEVKFSLNENGVSQQA